MFTKCVLVVKNAGNTAEVLNLFNTGVVAIKVWTLLQQG